MQLGVKTRTKLNWFIITAIFLLGAALRIYQLDAVDLRGDESYTALYWTQTPFTSDWYKMVHHEGHPVLVFFFWWSWSSLIGNSAFALRAFSVLGSLGSLAAITALGRRLLHEQYLVWSVALLWAVNPMNLWHAQDARMIGILSTLNILNFYFLLRATDKPANQTALRGLTPWLPYMLTQLLSLHLFFFEAFALLVQGLFVLSLRRRDIFLEAVRTWSILFVLTLPVIANLYDVTVVNAYGPTASIAHPTDYFTKFMGAYILGENTEISFIVGILIFSVLLLTLLIELPKQKLLNSLILLWIVAPAVVLYLISLKSALFRPRYGMTSMPAIIFAIVISLAFGARKIFQRANYQQFAVSSLVLLIAVILLYKDYQYFEVDEPKAPDWTSLQAYLDTNMSDEDVVVISGADPSIEYYYQGAGDIYFLVSAEDDIDEAFSNLNEYRSIYLLGGPNIPKLEQKIGAEWQFITADEIAMRHSSNIWHISEYRAWTVAEQEIMVPLNIQFADTAILKGYSWQKSDVDSDILMLYWHPLRQTEAPLSILTHVVPSANIDGPPVAVLDHGPANAIISTTQWQENVLYRDVITLPEGTLDNYTVRIGLYATGTLEPVELNDDQLQETYAGRYPLP